MKNRFGLLTALLALSTGTALAADTVKVGAPMVLSGPSAVVGQTALRGLQMAVDDVNKDGGLLGSQIELITADDAGNPATANTVTRDMILNDEVVAMFPGSNSASGAAEQVLAGQYKIPAVFFSATDVSMTTVNFNKYTFQMQASTYMVPRAWASFIKASGWKKVYVINPDINYGRSFTENMKKGLAENGSQATVIGEQFPAVGTTDFSSYISAVIAAKPDFLYLGLLPGDQVSFLRQAKGYGLLKLMQVGAPNAVDVISTLKDETPVGLALHGITPLFFKNGDPEIQKFAERYHDKYKEWPPEWPVVSYAAFQSWADGVRKAKSFDGPTVADALSGLEVNTIRGKIQFRACDHQAMIPVFIGKVDSKVDPKYGFPLMVDSERIAPEDTAMSCDKAVALQKK